MLGMEVRTEKGCDAVQWECGKGMLMRNAHPFLIVEVRYGDTYAVRIPTDVGIHGESGRCYARGWDGTKWMPFVWLFFVDNIR